MLTVTWGNWTQLLQILPSNWWNRSWAFVFFFLLFFFINKLCLFHLYIMDVNIQPMLITHKEHPLSIACLFYYSQARSRSLPTAPQKHTQFACSVQFTFSPLPPVTNQTDFISCKFSGFFLFSPIVTCCGYRCGGWWTRGLTHSMG